METGSSENTINNNMDDIHYLLHLESLKRYKEEAKDMHRQVEEQVRTYKEAQQEYKHEYQRLTKLKQYGLLCEALEGEGTTPINDSHVERSCEQLTQITDKISNINRPTELNMRILEECKQHLQLKHKPRFQLARQQLNDAENLETLKTISNTLEIAENGFDTATLVAMDQITSDLQPPVADE